MQASDQSPTKPRLFSVDALRGLVMVVMAIDHCRDYFFDLRVPVTDPATTSLSLFATRWITHFCAPTFVFLAGASAFLYGERAADRNQLRWFLWSRGVWLIFLEFSVIYFALTFSFDVVPWMFLVIAAIGSSMIALSLLCHLPTKTVGLIGIAIVALHNLLDPISIPPDTLLGKIWLVVHAGPGYIPEWNLEIGYSFLPWIGVICVGYGFGPLLMLPPAGRRAAIWKIGWGCIFMFILIRGVNNFGDPQPWYYPDTNSTSGEPYGETSEGDPPADNANAGSIGRAPWLESALSFVNTTKYPPSLVFVLMTLGPALLALAELDRLDSENTLIQILSTYGKVPLFFYLLHFYLIHLLSIGAYLFC